MFFGGLGLFLYGMQVMQQGIEKTAGDNMRVLLEKTTTNPISGVAIGAGVTMLMQSSSATTVMVVSFVSAGFMTLYQAMNVLIGANIGTTITAQIIALKIDSIAPLVLFLGVLPVMFGKKKIVQNIGMIIMGFGIIFLGMRLMSESVEPLRSNEALQAERDREFTFKTTIGDLFDLVGEETVKTLVQEKTAQASRIADYDRTVDNVVENWVMLFVFIIAFAALATISLEFIDKDRR